MPPTADALRKIVEDGSLAPSGDNLQPWHLDWQGDTVRISVDTSRDRSLYNFEYRASLIAIGAMIENIAIAASSAGTAADVECSGAGDNLLSASVRFRPLAALAPDPLAPFIRQRCTNRKPYRTEPLGRDVLAALEGAIPGGAVGAIRLIEDRAQLRVLARAASLNDRLLFEIQPLHDQFFQAVRWTEQEAAATRDGLYVKTLELGPMAAAFKAFRSWSVVRVMNALGSSLFAPVHSFQTFMKSPAFGFLQMPDVSPRAFLDGGRLLQRVWLTATSLGLGFQPMAGMLYLLNYLNGKDAGRVGEPQRAIIANADSLFRQVLPLDDRKASIMLFRIGYGPPPTATSLRRAI